ncbi:histidinol-phosphate aminotransferase family protein [Dehalococcoidia bacterium]|nr:histidinol-phosphate aminotransferase family protein [Dehalococcoidia bacterium]
MSLRPKPEVENLKVCPHGGPDYAELRAMNLTPEEVIDFSVSSNPFMPPPGIEKIFSGIAIDRYPDSEATELRQCLSEQLGVAPNNILVGSGSMELIRLIAMAYFGRGDSVLILEPTFGEYEVACRMLGAEVLKQWAKAEDCFALRLEETTSIIRQHRPRGIFICNPNNPTGQYLSRPEIEMVLDSCGDTLLILDEAYIAFTEGRWSSTDLISGGNVIILCSMTKDYALAGLRLGYAIAGEEIIQSLRKVCPPWNVNVVAQEAGIMALKNSEYLRQCESKIRQTRQFLIEELHRLDFTLVPSSTNFFLVKVANAKAFRTALLRHGILVRDCTSFGLPEYIRIAPRTMPECRKLIATIESLKREGESGAGIGQY